MAKKVTSSTALEFVFDANHLRRILESNPDKVLFTVKVEQAVTKTGEKVGALRIHAEGKFKGKPNMRTKDGGALGEPRPPGVI